MNLQWIIKTKNIEPGGCIAVLKLEDGTHVLHMFEGNDCHFTISCEQFSFIKTMKVPYELELRHLQDCYRTQFSILSEEKILEKKLEYACKQIEQNVTSQMRIHVEKAILTRS